ncbi:hypothetical protein [Halioglobus maricola]|uniref:hypothetical protein n=1 Tax=Halioglobus maricola TaxID=2601894 RepID=UPI0014790A05|nr:hypothetical protein [Halioglobus maricola]
MRDWWDEFVIVLSHSGRAQVAILLGLFFFVGVLTLGHWVTHDFELQILGPEGSASIAEAFRGRYEKVALASLIGFLSVAIQAYRKDRKRLFG